MRYQGRGVQYAMTFMVVNTDNYDVLFGLDFLMKIGAVVDVERGLIQVSHGPGTNVEVLPLTMVNLLQRMNLEALMQESTTIWKNTCTNDDFDWILDQDRAIMTKEDVASTSDSDTGTDEGSQEILQLILQEQVDEFMDEEITDADDYADWMRWVSDAEQSRRAMYESTHDAAIPLLLQQPSRRYASSIPALLQIVQMKNGNSDCSTIEQLGSSSHEEMDTRWREIYQRIRIDNNLDEGGQQELWKILEHYQDVFDWNKGELGIPGIKGSAG
ncbi:unnamed protein product [Sphagnum troendelagicum]|uniref:Uncharacterized protein n=1 Tax=Sphagnum troendelagicum TaxID=128251 RepID=A0ABP0TWX2_9BRYO